jgi:transposase
MDNSTKVGARPGDAERPQESGAAAPGRGGRMSRQRKMTAVLRLLRGEDLELVSRSLGVTAATLTAWRDAFLAAGEAALAFDPSIVGGASHKSALETHRSKMLEIAAEKYELGLIQSDGKIISVTHDDVA